MKVLSFLEIEQHDCPVELWERTNEVINKHGYQYRNEYYAQTFKPELITELFEGWEQKTQQGYSGNGGSYYIGFDNEKYIIAKTNCNAEWLNIPRTLDDFINDSQRAGIELKWRIK